MQLHPLTALGHTSTHTLATNLVTVCVLDTRMRHGNECNRVNIGVALTGSDMYHTFWVLGMRNTQCGDLERLLYRIQHMKVRIF
jgi:hypothetical protein